MRTTLPSNSALGIRSSGRLAVLVCVLIACSNSPAEVMPLASGTYPLASRGGEPLPVDYGVQPPNPVTGEVSSCHLVLTTGSLQLNSAAGTYRYEYEYHESCTQRLMSKQFASGPYRQVGDSLYFEQPARDTTFRFTGSVEASAVIVNDGGPLLRFRR